MNPHNLNFDFSHTCFVHFFLFFSAFGGRRSSRESEEAIELGVRGRDRAGCSINGCSINRCNSIFKNFTFQLRSIKGFQLFLCKSVVDYLKIKISEIQNLKNRKLKRKRKRKQKRNRGSDLRGAPEGGQSPPLPLPGSPPFVSVSVFVLIFDFQILIFRNNILLSGCVRVSATFPPLGGE